MKKNKGFSLLEILIALAVMLVGIVGTLGLFPAGLRASKVASNFTRATILGERSLEDIKRAGYASLPAAPSTPSWTQFTTTNDTDFWWWEEVTNPAINNLRKVEIRIGWDDRGTSHTSNYLTFITYVANN